VTGPDALFPSREPVDPEPVAITLPSARLALYHYGAGDPDEMGMWPRWNCGYCLEPFEDGEPVRHTTSHGWGHEKCVIETLTTSTVDQAWLLLADAVTHRPSAFKASDIRAVMQNVARIARRAA